MSVTKTPPNIVYTPNAGVFEHLRIVNRQLEKLTEIYGMEPADIVMSWRDEDDFTGWRTIIKWPVRIVL